MPIDPGLLAKSIATLTDLDPELDLATTLEQAVVAAKQPLAPRLTRSMTEGHPLVSPQLAPQGSPPTKRLAPRMSCYKFEGLVRDRVSG